MPTYIDATKNDVEEPIVLIEIALTDGNFLRFCANTEDLTHSGNVYKASSFQSDLQADPASGDSIATVSIPNDADGALGKMLETHDEKVIGAAMVRRVILASNPNVSHVTTSNVIRTYSISAQGISLSSVTTKLGGVTATPYVFTRENLPGIFN